MTTLACLMTKERRVSSRVRKRQTKPPSHPPIIRLLPRRVRPSSLRILAELLGEPTLALVILVRIAIALVGALPQKRAFAGLLGRYRRWAVSRRSVGLISVRQRTVRVYVVVAVDSHVERGRWYRRVLTETNAIVIRGLLLSLPLYRLNALGRTVIACQVRLVPCLFARCSTPRS